MDETSQPIEVLLSVARDGDRTFPPRPRGASPPDCTRPSNCPTSTTRRRSSARPGAAAFTANDATVRVGILVVGSEPACQDGDVEYRYLGSSGLRVSELCLGSMTFGDLAASGWSLDDKHMERLTAAGDRPLPYPHGYLTNSPRRRPQR